MLEQKPRATGADAISDAIAQERAADAAAPQPDGTLYDREEVARVTQARTQWEATAVAQAIKRVPEAHADATTQSGMPIQRLYTPPDGAHLSYERDLGFPGEYPYTRGVQPTMYRAKPWTMRMFAGFGTAEETNERFKYLLAQGQTGLSVAFDMATLYGYDHDHPMALGEFGKCGVAVSSLADMEILFKDIPLDQVTTSMTINSPAPAIWAMYIAAAEKRGVPMERLGGTLQNDILKEYIAQKEFLFPPEPSMRLVVDTIEFGTRHLPRWNTISISGYHIREAGATAVQELAFTLADGLAYVDATLARGLGIDEFAPRLSFFFDVHNDFFEEVAKFRAARRIWAREMRERYGAQDPRSWLLRFYTQTAGSTLTAQQPDNNIVRTAYQAMAAVLGGTQSLHTNGFDEALSLPTENAVRVALRTQQILAYETGVADTSDPLAGSYYVESLTDALERMAWQYITTIDELGGSVRAIEQGYIQREVEEAAYRYQQALEERRAIVVGVNRFQVEEEQPIPILRVDPEVERRQAAKVAALRDRRDNVAVTSALAALEDAARGTANLLPRILAAVEAYATLGEISDTLRAVFGEQREARAI